MQDSNIPTKFPIPWANAAGGAYLRNIPQASQIGITNGAASLTDGFPPNCFVPIAGGGSWPWGQDANGILKQITQWLQWQQAGGPINYDATFQTAIGGYPAGAIVQSATTIGVLWLCLVDNNATNPDTGGAGWQLLVRPVRNVIHWKLISGVQQMSVNGAAFTATGATSFTPPYSTTGDLEIQGAGGGSGGAAGSGGSGGGAAGSYGRANVALTAGTPIAVSVGAGGLGGVGATGDGSTGGASTFGGITAPGGPGSPHCLTATSGTGASAPGPVTGTGVYFSQLGLAGYNGGSIGVIGGGTLITPAQGSASFLGSGNSANAGASAENWGSGAGGTLGTSSGNAGSGGTLILRY